MRAVRAKRLRKAMNFHPAKEREYTGGETHAKLDMYGKAFAVTGTVTCGGPRGAYQKVKRAKVLTEAVLRAGMLEAAHG